MTTTDGETDLDHVIDKLAARYPDRPRESLRSEVEKARQSFSGATVQGFLGVLIERQVRANLGDAPGL
jgi:BioD-like phosphotransacetylase family protein